LAGGEVERAAFSAKTEFPAGWPRRQEDDSLCKSAITNYNYKMMDLVFCGTPQFAVPTLAALLQAGDFRLRLIVCQPDRPAGRGLALTAPPVKQLAQAHALPVTQPQKIKDNQEFREQLESARPDAIVVVAYGRIIPPWMIALPPLGNINLHASLLPKYRGAAPIQWALAGGETVTGITTMRIDAGLDTGDVLLQRELSITPEDTAETLAPKLAELGAPLMVETLRSLKRGAIIPTPQNSADATLAPLLQREDGRIDFRHTNMEIWNRMRGFTPWPGTYTSFRGKTLNIKDAIPAGTRTRSVSPGELYIEDEHLYVACAKDTALQILALQLEGKKRMSAGDFVHGYHPKIGEKLG
jgi:methionyl-tRNA formyltransferase